MLSQAQIDEVVRLLAENLPRKNIAQRTGVSLPSISNIAIGKRSKRAVEYRYYNPSPQEIAAECARIRDERQQPNPQGANDLSLPVYDAETMEIVA